MKMNIENLRIASNILTETLNNVQEKRTQVPAVKRNPPVFLTNIYCGNHKTYKYILFTALLAKTAFQDEIDALSLQEGDGSRYGSFDARSLAHKVVVPFEREFLNNALGGSNEPYLNKPARFPTISKNNAVRTGQDKEKLDSLVDNLENITAAQASEWLEDSIKILLDIAQENKLKFENNFELSNDLQSIKKLFIELTVQNFGGEMLALSIGGLLSLLFDSPYTIKVHKVNQSGASSKETGDIDVFLGETIAHSFEAKSKNFTLQDVQHALSKARASGLQTFYFIYNHTTISSELLKQADEYGEKIGIVISLLSFEKFLPALLGLANNTAFSSLPNKLLLLAKEMQISDDALSYTKSVLERFSK